MDDGKKDEASRTAALGALISKAAAQVRQGGEASLEGVRRSVAEVGDRLKSSQASQQVGSAVESWRLIKKAADAQRRGNPAMAYRLLEPQVQAHPDDPKLVAAFFRAALACERVAEAVPFMVGVIRQLASTGKVERALELWTELRDADPSARVDSGSLVRIAEALERAGSEELLVDALRGAAASDATGLSPGLAVRIAEMAAGIDPPTALRAVCWALDVPDLHQAKRERLEALAAELGADDDTLRRGVERAAAQALDQVDTVARFHDLKLREAMPTELRSDAVALQLVGGRTGRVEYTKVDAIAVAEVMGLAQHPVVVVDLLLNWCDADDPTLRVVRLRGDGFDPRMVIDAPDDRDEAFAQFLRDLSLLCECVVLPTGTEVGTGTPPRFESLDAYTRQVLLVGA